MQNGATHVSGSNTVKVKVIVREKIWKWGSRGAVGAPPQTLG